MKRLLSEWASANMDILAIGDILTANEVYALMSVKYSSWKSTFTVDADNPSEKDDVINMLWQGYVSTSLPKLKNAVATLSNLTGKKEYQKKIDGTLKQSGDTTRTPNLSDATINGKYSDSTVNSGYTDTSETINSSVAFNTLAEKEREKQNSKNENGERRSTTNYGENTSTINRTGTETNMRNLTDKNDVTETGYETSPELLRDSIELINKQPVYDFIDRFVHQFFTF